MADRRTDMVVIVTDPVGAGGSSSALPFELDRPDDLVFCCFFRTTECRTAFLARLKAAAGVAPIPADSFGGVERELTQEYLSSMSAGDPEAALAAAVAWRAGSSRSGYHAYSLKVEFAPYRTSCLISFHEMDAVEMRSSVARALRQLERERGRIQDVFGWGLREV